MTDEHPIVVFIQAQLDHDEQVARAATPGPWSVDDTDYAEAIYGADPNSAVVAGGRWGNEASVFDTTETAEHIALHDPARALREVAAKRRIVARHSPRAAGPPNMWATPPCGWPSLDPCPDLRDLLSIYSDRPGYDPSWVAG